jgi:hypothetical protein
MMLEVLSAFGARASEAVAWELPLLSPLGDQSI